VIEAGALSTAAATHATWTAVLSPGDTGWDSRTLSAAAITHLAAKTSHLKGKRPLVIDGDAQKSVNAYDSAEGRGRRVKKLCHPLIKWISASLVIVNLQSVREKKPQPSLCPSQRSATD
jgi:hypothetical protein